MSAQAWPAQGAIVAYSTNAGSTYTTVGEVLSISGFGGGEVGERDTTVLTSTAHTNAPTIPDNGEPTFSLNWDPTDAAHQQIRTWKNTPPAVSALPLWKVTWNTTSANTDVFTAWVKSIDGINAEGVDENMTADITLRVSGTVIST